jgi:hypothetical protein
MVLLGALVAALLPEYQSGYRVVHRFAGRRYYAALMILAELARAREEGKARPLSVLTRCSRIGVAETEKVLNQLRAAHWVERSEKQRWLLSCDLEKVPLQAVFSHFALDLNDWPSPQSDEEDRLIHRLKQAHGCAPRGLEVSLSALLDPASPTTQSGG